MTQSAYASPIDISSFTDLVVAKVVNRSPRDKVIECAFALDIGGSLAKLAYQHTFRYKVCVPKELSDPHSKRRPTICGPFEFYDYREHEYEGHKLCFTKFETRHIDSCLEFIRSTILPAYTDVGRESIHLVGRVTGGGSFKYMPSILEKLGDVEIEREDEMASLVRGCTFLLRNIPDEAFIYDKRAMPSQIFLSSFMVNTAPFLLVNIGSGVSFLKVEADASYKRVGGTSLGGGTFWGIGSLLAGGQMSFDELLELADKGDHRQVDMLVKDIYGGAYESLGLAADVIASSFGLAARRPNETRRPADMVKALLVAISNNIGQLACLYALQNGVGRILFGGFFIRGHRLTMEVISFAVNYWSNGALKAMFLRHEGYLGAVGAFMKASQPPTFAQCNGVETGEASASQSPNNQVPQKQQRHSSKCWSESYATSLIARSSMPPSSSTDGLTLSDFELEHLGDMSLEPFPLLLSPADYVPDTWDLTQDCKARAYWLECFKQGVERLRKKAEESQAEKTTAGDSKERAQLFANRYVNFLTELNVRPSGRGLLTVRSILEAQQHLLREFGFPDAFCVQKKLENTWSLTYFPSIMKRLGRLAWTERQMELAQGFLTGNIFDWGASEAVRFFTQSQDSVEGMASFEQALAKLQPRPWLVDDFSRWLERISNPADRPRCVLIFCDNSGADLILGVLPFVVECLDWGSKVILTANSVPAINDVTYRELLFLLNEVAGLEPRLQRALEDGRLMCVDNGQSSPCLDLRQTSHRLVQLVKKEKVDLIVIEGMGRAVHTNLYARFCVDCLKVAVIKNSWLACRLGGDLFSVIFRYEEYSSESDSAAATAATVKQAETT
ncbi:pantothenate kinase 4 [Echinococcus multilocularis]|uniref:4'-phosphopantetheine phosphatase n=1 Tax=Echinococcus multilocularis TaxID=6211 RepID=A0A068Y3I5_ECHMU|nr:pantothenate kinase 4 [Echinococcus multilocularis]